ncbi:MAG: hypothetical protein ACRYGK_18270 [Janthinobacterium lividum]
MILNLLTCMLAFGLEIAALVIALQSQASVAQVVYFVLAHLLVSLAMAHCVTQILARCKLRRSAAMAPHQPAATALGGRSEAAPVQVMCNGAPYSIGWLVFLTSFSIPGCGVAGVLSALLPALYFQRKAVRPPRWQHARITDVGQQAGVAVLPRHFASSLKAILAHARDPQRRLQALIATLALDDLRAAPLLRIALKDADDEVRLLSYALMTRKEKALEQHIHMALAGLELASSSQHLRYRRALAHHFWEMGHLCPDGDGARQFYDMARLHAQHCTAASPGDGALLFLLGRILLKLQMLEASRSAFSQAIEAGIDAGKVRPFLAELAFLRRRFGEIGALLAPAEPQGQSIKLAAQHAYWSGGLHAAH